ncbi:MAG TPA: hypothetical protein VH988_21220 [Thermoanaerobaculia bacterium]|jgi:hypothetical protein|nr:hypothetical protein [Thermoanaerobaculia bacterium]
MKKKHSTAKQKTAALRLRTETLRRLDDSELQTVAGGAGRIRIPIGFEDDTTPIYADIAG